MQMVTLEAEKWFVLLQQVVCYRAMRIVADGAVFFYRGMLIGKRPLLVRMAPVAQVVDPFFGFQIVQAAAVIVVTVGAFHLPFPDRMMGRIVDFGPNILVTSVTELRLRHL
jgi:hypothetical protein